MFLRRRNFRNILALLLNWSHVVSLGYVFDKFLSRHTIQSLQNAVVVHDHEVSVWNDQCHEEIEIFLASDLSTRGDSLLPPFLAHVERGLSSMMAVRNKQLRNIIERHNEKIGVFS